MSAASQLRRCCVRLCKHSTLQRAKRAVLLVDFDHKGRVLSSIIVSSEGKGHADVEFWVKKYRPASSPGSRQGCHCPSQASVRIEYCRACSLTGFGWILSLMQSHFDACSRAGTVRIQKIAIEQPQSPTRSKPATKKGNTARHPPPRRLCSWKPGCR